MAHYRRFTIICFGMFLMGCTAAISPPRFAYVPSYTLTRDFVPVYERGAVATWSEQQLYLYLPCLLQDDEGRILDQSPCSDTPLNTGLTVTSTTLSPRVIEFMFCLIKPAAVDAEGYVTWLSARRCEEINEKSGSDPYRATAKMGVTDKAAQNLSATLPRDPAHYGQFAGKEIRLVRIATKDEVKKIWFWIKTDMAPQDVFEKMITVKPTSADGH